MHEIVARVWGYRQTIGTKQRAAANLLPHCVDDDTYTSYLLYYKESVGRREWWGSLYPTRYFTSAEV